MASTATTTGHRKTTGTTMTIPETHVTIKQINHAQVEENLTVMKVAETLAGQVAQLTEQQKKANSQSATNPVHSPGC